MIKHKLIYVLISTLLSQPLCALTAQPTENQNNTKQAPQAVTQKTDINGQNNKNKKAQESQPGQEKTDKINHKNKVPQNKNTQNFKNPPLNVNTYKPQAITTAKNKNKIIDLQTIKNNPNIYDLDTIVAVIFTTEGQAVITKSDISKPGITGAIRSIEDIIFENLVYFDAKKLKADPDEDAIDKYLASIQKEHGLTADQLEDIFKSAGYTIEEGRQQFKIMQSVNTMLDFKIRSNLIVPRSQIEKYYEENPAYREPRYELRHVIVPYSDNKEVQKNNLLNQIKYHENIEEMNWSKAFWINESEIDESKLHLISSLQQGEISEPQEVTGGFELYHVMDKKEKGLVPLDDRRIEIIDILRTPRYLKLLDEYKKSLYESASILYL